MSLKTGQLHDLRGGEPNRGEEPDKSKIPSVLLTRRKLRGGLGNPETGQ